MSILDIHIYEDPVLREVAKPIETITDQTRRLAIDMIETMYAALGIGLAANQVGVLERMVVIDVDWADDKDDPSKRSPIVMINPEIIDETAEDDDYSEGCLSVPGIEGDVWRPMGITARYTDLDSEQVEIECRDLFARAILHEIDHLDGVLFFDRMAEAERKKLNVQLKQLAETEPPEGNIRTRAKKQ